MFYLEYNHTSQNSDIVDIRYDLLRSSCSADPTDALIE